jgi:glycosyltransferase involved in cell wall biosynthesis
MKSDLSVIIISGNFQDQILDCLRSVEFASEIILVAANSTDDTKKIALKYDPKIKIIETFDEYNKNFSKWRNLGYKAAKCKWLLYVDTDERVSHDLKVEILSMINATNNPYNHFAIPRQNYYLHHRVEHGGTFPDYVKRLFLRSAFSGYKGILHEEPIIHGETGLLKGYFSHYTHTDIRSMLQKSIVWSDMEAQALYQNKHPTVVWWRIIRMMITKLYERLLKQQMWRDGTVGWISVIFETFNTFMIYARLWELQQNKQ